MVGRTVKFQGNDAMGCTRPGLIRGRVMAVTNMFLVAAARSGKLYQIQPRLARLEMNPARFIRYTAFPEE